MSYGRETMMSGLRKAGQGIGAADDGIQGLIRRMYGINDSKPHPHEGINPRVAMAVQTLHPLRSDIDDTWQGKTALIGSRAFQAGSITAAGAGLMALADQFGGPADQPEPSQLGM